MGFGVWGLGFGQGLGLGIGGFGLLSLIAQGRLTKQVPELEMFGGLFREIGANSVFVNSEESYTWDPYDVYLYSCAGARVYSGSRHKLQPPKLFSIHPN